jgi:hypothetical protein
VRYVLLGVVDAVAYVRRTDIDKKTGGAVDDGCSEVLSRKQLKSSSTCRVDESPHSSFIVGGPT